MQVMNNPNMAMYQTQYNAMTMPGMAQHPMYSQGPQPMVSTGPAPNVYPAKPNVDPRAFEIPEIVTTSKDSDFKPPLFTASDETKSDKMTIKVDNLPAAESVPANKKKKVANKDKNGMVRGTKKSEPLTGTVVEDAPTAYTYMETTGLLRETLGQIDALNGELVKEFNSVRQSRTMKNKYNTLVGLSENIGSLIGNRISAIKEINNSITKSNDLDFKKFKELKVAEDQQSEDKYIADFYQSIIRNPANVAPTPQFPAIDPSMVNSGIIRAQLGSSSIEGNGTVDASYLQYMSNLTPEQKLMRYENDPNVKQVVVFDHATGNKFFQMMNVSTGEVITGVPVYGEVIMQDTYIDMDKGIAKNSNINETFPLIEINKGAQGVASQY